ncbi:hypothetical protein C1I97_00385 [Streptomyces sp. NTH33]|uniref:hypothetical protein n=1 Tax=Streptomyces sp. NTH33 TaxID=1735453 RepID=UPI000DA92C27|nr:hypothetical protein [Streptomyces sp. NTH33]PZH21015.1 hypothetical protein C1I97_00385 [Streptomyces sp. NTH33]
MGPRRTTRSAGRRTGLVLAAATALAVITACTAVTGSSEGRGGDDRAGRGEDAARAGSVAALRAVARSTGGADSVRVESRTTMGSMMSMTADGALSWSDGLTGTLTITYTDGPVADAMRRLGSTSMEARYLPDAYYARMGDAFAARTGGRHWLRYRYDDVEAVAGASGARLGDQMRATAPHQCVKLLLASGDVRKVGEERVRGTRATHYTGRVEAGDPGVTGRTVDIWIDDRDLLVKKVERAETATGRLTQTAHYEDYGVKVTTETPPPGDTRDAKDLVDGQSGA